MKRTRLKRLLLRGVFLVLLTAFFAFSGEMVVGAETYDCSLCHGTVVSDFTVAPVDRAAVCSKCHFGQHWTATVQTPYGWFASEQSAYAGAGIIHANGVHINSDYRNKAPFSEYCERCHAPASCTACHENVKHGQHGGSAVEPVTMLTTTGGFLSWPAPETFTCGNSSCHTPLPEVVKTRPDGSELCLNCHSFGKAGHGDLSTVHLSNYVSNMPFNCAACHKNDLVAEHEGRVSDAGVPLSCATCHASTVSAVQQAVKEGRTNCDACHGTPIHANVAQEHISSNTTCTACHKDSLTKVPYLTSIHSDCTVCHSSQNPYVKNAITSRNTDCLTCHRTGGATHPHLALAHEKVECRACHLNEAAILDQSVHGASRANVSCRKCHINLVFTDPYADSVDLREECTSCHGNKVNMGNDKGCVPCHLNPGESFIDGNPLWGHYLKKRNNWSKTISR